MPRRRKGKRIYRASPYTHPLYRRWMIDYDYLEKLDEKSQSWLAQFTDEHYAADYRFPQPLTHGVKDKREGYARDHVNERDLYSRKAAIGAMDFEKELGYSVTPSPTPEYLQSNEYRELLAEYRQLVDQCKPPRRKSTREPIATPDPQIVARRDMLQEFLLSITESDPSSEGLEKLMEYDESQDDDS